MPISGNHNTFIGFNKTLAHVYPKSYVQKWSTKIYYLDNSITFYITGYICMVFKILSFNLSSPPPPPKKNTKKNIGFNLNLARSFNLNEIKT